LQRRLAGACGRGARRLPPVDAFWSVTMDDGTTQLLIENPIGRYGLTAPSIAPSTHGTFGSPATSASGGRPDKTAIRGDVAW